MMTASEKSERCFVKSSVFLALDASMGFTQTGPPLGPLCRRGFQLCPVGSQAITTPEKPAARAIGNAQSSTWSITHGEPANILLASSDAGVIRGGGERLHLSSVIGK